MTLVILLVIPNQLLVNVVHFDNVAYLLVSLVDQQAHAEIIDYPLEYLIVIMRTFEQMFPHLGRLQGVSYLVNNNPDQLHFLLFLS